MTIYNTAASILQKIHESKSNLKSMVYSCKEKDKKRLLKLVCETLKYKTSLQIVLSNAKVKTGLDSWLELVLAWDLLFGKGKVQNKILLKNKVRLVSEVARLKIKNKVSKDEELSRSILEIPKYIRVNSLKTSSEVVYQHFLKKGFKFVQPQQVVTQKKCISKDNHLENLFLLHSSTDLHDDSMYKDGSILFQDKASCFPAFLLNPEENSMVIDATAAPGNKTSHLSAIMKNTGTIYAFEKDFKRFNTLKRMTDNAGCKNIIAENMDFLKVDPKSSRYSKVKYILLDPSCSGSGIVGRLDDLIMDSKDSNKSDEKERLESLSSFQKEIILHALKFPKVEKIVYSTCSIHKEENEDVVEYILNHQQDFKLEENVFPDWKRRGLKEFKYGIDYKFS